MILVIRDEVERVHRIGAELREIGKLPVQRTLVVPKLAENRLSGFVGQLTMMVPLHGLLQAERDQYAEGHDR